MLHPDLTTLIPQLAVWPISGNSTEARSIQKKQPQILEVQSYDSLFRKWHSWCREWNSDPVSGPVTEVANFLASLHKEGYQYNSINPIPLSYLIGA